jgi:hypothetical protein
MSREEAWALVQAKSGDCLPPLEESEVASCLDIAWKYAAADARMSGIEPHIRELLGDLHSDHIILPNDYVPFPCSASRIFSSIAIKCELYMRGGAIVELRGKDPQIMTGGKLRSRIDAQAVGSKA